jgi:hypothetical protein
MMFIDGWKIDYDVRMGIVIATNVFAEKLCKNIGLLQSPGTVFAEAEKMIHNRKAIL